MSEVSKHPYLQRRKSTYYYRRKIPTDVKAHYAPKAEIIFSLKTSDRAEATRKANVETVRLDEAFENLRYSQRDAASVTLTNQQVKALTEGYLHRLLEEDEQVRFDGTGDAEVYAAVGQQVEDVPGTTAVWKKRDTTVEYGLSERDYRKLGDGLHLLAPFYRNALARGDISVVFDTVDEVLEEEGLQLERNSSSYQSLAREVLKVEVRAHELLERRHIGELVETPSAPVVTNGPQGVVVTGQNNEDGDVTCSVLFERYREERQLPEKTASDFGAYVRRFIELCEDLPVSKVTKVHARGFKDAMLKYPSRPAGELRSMTVPEVIEAVADQPDVKRLSPQTVNDKALGALRAMFSYAVDNDYRQDNPFSGIKATGPKSYEPSRIPYTVADLKLIFATPVFAEAERPKAGGGEAAKWLPLLALYTGARLEELGRLTVEDVRSEEGVEFLFIRGGQDGRSLKTKSSRRKVPIHSELIKLGFLDYVAAARRSRTGMLWPDLSSRQAQVTAGFSKWWGRYVRQHGLTDDRKVFHSFRHLVKRQLRNARVEKALVDALQGHAAQDVADRVYGLDEEGFGVALPILKDAIEELAYPGLELERLCVRRPAQGA